MATLPRDARERDELEEEDEEAEREQQREAGADDAVAAGTGRLDRVAARDAECPFDKPGAGEPVAADEDQPDRPGTNVPVRVVRSASRSSRCARNATAQTTTQRIR